MSELQKLHPELIVVAGCMFAGKSDELIRRIRRYMSVGRCVQVFKPALDNRYSSVDVVAHNGLSLNAIPIERADEILHDLHADTEVVAIDEVQFLNHNIVDICEELLTRDIVVLAAGLPLDFRGEGFGCMPMLMAKAEAIIQVNAYCTVCGLTACRTQRIVNGKPASWNDPILLVGAQEAYEARCRKHHEVPGKPRFL